MSDPKTVAQRTDRMIDRMLGGDRLALARLITQVENRTAALPAIMKAVYPRAHGAYVVGVTGPPGAGKSTVVDRLTVLLRAEGATVGVVAVDPSSPFTGGAVLGDRIRMQAHALDPGVFIRSMATRGSHGGLARATGDTITLLAAAGYAWVLVETVGVGQTELDIMKLADTTVVVLVPESGDAIQTMKAGLMEAADVFLVNKADRSGAPALMAELTFAAHLSLTSAASPKNIGWEIPVLSAEAQSGVGIAELLADVRRHRAALEAAGALAARRRARGREAVKRLMLDAVRQKDEAAPAAAPRLDRIRERVALVGKHALGQAKTLSQAYPGVMHAIMFWGFLALFMGTVLATIDYDITVPLLGYKLLKGSFYLVYETVLDLFGLFFVLGLGMALWRRFVLRPERIDPTARFAGALALLLVINVTGFVIEACRLAAVRPAWAAWSPVGWFLAQGMRAAGMSEGALRATHLSVWLFHAAVSLAFVAVIPYSYFVHLITTPLNIFFAKLGPRGELREEDVERRREQVDEVRVRDDRDERERDRGVKEPDGEVRRPERALRHARGQHPDRKSVV